MADGETFWFGVLMSFSVLMFFAVTVVEFRRAVRTSMPRP